MNNGLKVYSIKNEYTNLTVGDSIILKPYIANGSYFEGTQELICNPYLLITRSRKIKLLIAEETLSAEPMFQNSSTFLKTHVLNDGTDSILLTDIRQKILTIKEIWKDSKLKMPEAISQTEDVLREYKQYLNDFAKKIISRNDGSSQPTKEELKKGLTVTIKSAQQKSRKDKQLDIIKSEMPTDIFYLPLEGKIFKLLQIIRIKGPKESWENNEIPYNQSGTTQKTSDKYKKIPLELLISVTANQIMNSQWKKYLLVFAYNGYLIQLPAVLFKKYDQF